MKSVQMKNVGEMDGDCFYSGSYIDDPGSNILVTGCKAKTILIQSAFFGDHLGTITINGIFEIAHEPDLTGESLDNPEYNPAGAESIPIPGPGKTFVASAEIISENIDSNRTPLDVNCNCEEHDVHCWTECLTRLIPITPQTSVKQQASDGSGCQKSGSGFEFFFGFGLPYPLDCSPTLE
jgi:hypothetical protein